MAKRELPTLLEKRTKLYGDAELPPEHLIRRGDAYFQAEQHTAAIAFYSKAKHRPGLEKAKALALESGNAFLLMEIARAHPDMVSNEEWIALGRRAEELGKFQYAITAYEASAHREGLERIAPEMLVTEEEGTGEEKASATDKRLRRPLFPGTKAIPRLEGGEEEKAKPEGA
jgi:tetratricopeptide (TPR) repeat protein